MKYLMVLAWLFVPLFCLAELAEQYKNQAGSFSPIKLATPIGANGSPLVSAYKDGGGQWRQAQVIENICGVDGHSRPIPCHYLNSQDVGSPGGVAPLDINLNMKNNVISKSINVLRSYTDSSGNVVDGIQIALANGAGDPLSGGQDAVWLGGFALPQVTSDGNDTATSSIVNIVARPYGNYNNGCALCLIATGGSQTDSSGRAAISGSDWRSGVSANAGMGDLVGLYEHLDNAPARLVLTAAAFTATSVTLPQPLTPEQINQLRQGMYIFTNVIDPTVQDTGTPAGKIATPRFYGAYVTSWSGATITVNGWSVLGQATPSTPVVPDIKHLDNSIYSNRSVPTIWLGSPAKIFAHNSFMQYVEQASGQETSLARNFEGEESDFVVQATKPHSVGYAGYVISPQSTGALNDGSEFTTDSAGYVLAGNLPLGFVFWNGCNTRPIVGSSVYVGSWCSKLDASSAAGTSFTMAENDAVANGYTFRQVLRLQQDAAGGNPNMYLGPVATPGTAPSPTNADDLWYGQLNGYINGAIKYGLSDSSISLCGTGVNCGLTVSGGGAVIEPLSTPASSSAPCTPGQFEDDADYHYVCVAQNIWKRAALSSF